MNPAMSTRNKIQQILTFITFSLSLQHTQTLINSRRSTVEQCNSIMWTWLGELHSNARMYRTHLVYTIATFGFLHSLQKATTVQTALAEKLLRVCYFNKVNKSWRKSVKIPKESLSCNKFTNERKSWGHHTPAGRWEQMQCTEKNDIFHWLRARTLDSRWHTRWRWSLADSVSDVERLTCSRRCNTWCSIRRSPCRTSTPVHVVHLPRQSLSTFPFLTFRTR